MIRADFKPSPYTNKGSVPYLPIAGRVVELTGQPCIHTVSTLGVRGHITLIALSKRSHKRTLKRGTGDVVYGI